jgi:hypothetical protein
MGPRALPNHLIDVRARYLGRLLAPLVGVAFVASCASSGESASDDLATMPDVVGERLDVAQSDLSAAGVDEDDVEVVGGGTFGVVDESNWTVCEQSPAAGSAANDVRVVVDRSCDEEGAETETTTSPTTTSPSTTAAPTTTSPPSPAPALMTLPDAVGMDLQAAQDTMQSAGFFVLTSHDATGQGRFQVSDRNWTVCVQSPPGGSQVSADTLIDFGAVKDDESCL